LTCIILTGGSLIFVRSPHQPSPHQPKVSIPPFLQPEYWGSKPLNQWLP